MLLSFPDIVIAPNFMLYSTSVINLSNPFSYQILGNNLQNVLNEYLNFFSVFNRTDKDVSERKILWFIDVNNEKM